MFNCCNVEMLFLEGARVCQICGITYDCLPTEEPLTPNSETHQVKPFLYKRAQHFINWLKRIQAQDTKPVPQEVLTLLQNCRSVAEARKLLKKNGFARFYGNVPSILHKVQGSCQKTLTVEVERMLVRDFQAVEIAFEVVKEKQRKNMLPYAYILFKLFKLRGINIDFQLHVSKNPHTLAAYDDTWNKVCKLCDFTEPQEG